jgi:hypothetical protein
MTTATPRRIRSAALLVGLIAAASTGLAACSSNGGGSAVSTPTPPPSTAGHATSTSQPTQSATATASTATTAASTATVAAGPATCSTAQLKVGQENANVGAGQYTSTLVFTNTSHETCTMTGYPGVSYVAADGIQSGNAATRTGTAYRPVTLAPGAKADAALQDSNGISGYTPVQCQLTSVLGLRIYPPGDKGALFLPWNTQHCAGSTIHSLTIGPVTQG